MKITTAYCFEKDAYRLYATNHGRTEVAGPRILRAAPWPDVRWTHETQGEADADAGKLQKYLDDLPSARKKKSTAKGAHAE